MWDAMQQMAGTLDASHFANPQEGTEAAAQILDLLKIRPCEKDIETIQTALALRMVRPLTETTQYFPLAESRAKGIERSALKHECLLRFQCEPMPGQRIDWRLVVGESFIQ